MPSNERKPQIMFLRCRFIIGASDKIVSQQHKKADLQFHLTVYSRL
jgi:hypothetical protein